MGTSIFWELRLIVKFLGPWDTFMYNDMSYKAVDIISYKLSLLQNLWNWIFFFNFGIVDYFEANGIHIDNLVFEMYFFDT